MMNRSVLERQMFAGGGLVGAANQLRQAQSTLQNVSQGLGQVAGGGQAMPFGGPSVMPNLGELQKQIQGQLGQARQVGQVINQNTFNQGDDPAAPGVGLSTAPRLGEGPQFPATMLGMAQALPQMFEKGGAAGFPDLNNDGDITQADILMGRGVKMQEGGDPMAAMMAQQAPMMAPEMAAPMPLPTAPGPDDMPDMGVGAVDQATVEQMLGEVAPAIGDPEQAESVEEMMNMVRGDEASVEDRRMELASIVGEEDAMQTPESVLALVQPIVQLALADQVGQGIGGLAEQEMQEPVQGDMAGGIMSMMGG